MITVREVSARKDIKAFMEFANKLYNNNPYYVPDMLSSQINDFMRDLNPAFEYCDAKCFLACRNGEIVGRIAAIYNTHANEKYGTNQMRFSHADYIDDAEVVDALFSAVEAFAKEKGCVSVHGPLGFSDLDREGLLVEGFDRVSQFFVNYNHPYYMRHMERMGYKKDTDWIEFLIPVPDMKNPDERIQRLKRLSDVVEKRMRLHAAPLKSNKSIKPYVEKIFKLYNETYEVLYGMVALSPAQVQKYVKEFLPLISERSTMILLNEQEEVVAFGVSAPSLSKAQQKSRGKMAPFGWYHLLKALKGKNEIRDLFLIAVRPDLQGKGVNTVIIYKLLEMAYEDGVKFAETGPELESNADVQSHWRFFDPEQHKRRRAYIKAL